MRAAARRRALLDPATQPHSDTRAEAVAVRALLDEGALSERADRGQHARVRRPLRQIERGGVHHRRVADRAEAQLIGHEECAQRLERTRTGMDEVHLEHTGPRRSSRD